MIPPTPISCSERPDLPRMALRTTLGRWPLFRHPLRVPINNNNTPSSFACNNSTVNRNMAFLTSLETKSGESVDESTLAGKLVILYFASSWCPACLTFTPLLTDLYQTVQKEGKLDLQIVHVSSDTDEASCHDIMEKTHGDWLRIPYQSDLRYALKEKYGVFAAKERGDFSVPRRSGIPTLLVVSPEGKEMAILDCDDAKVIEDVKAQGTSLLDPWKSFLWSA
eukprot:Nitzschia sp. Nitz4//scaffold423_size8454//1358//2143//NITZ4_009120-RA/size8454-snap-gene-0.8-mRNA-1//-1//CDS//3329551585//2697//frame0